MASKPRDRERAERERRGKINRDFAQRHPVKAREERALRKQHSAAQRDFGHKRHGTVETLQKASSTHQGAIARLYEAGHLTIDQLAASQQIRTVADRLGRDVTIGMVSLEARVDNGRAHDANFFESLGAVRAEVAYGRWRKWLGHRAAMVLAIVVEDLACSTAARQWRMRDAKARAILSNALDGWSDFLGDACDEIDEATLLAAQAGIL